MGEWTVKTLISIDAGMSTGLIVGTYSDVTPFELTHAFQIEGGVEGFLNNVVWDKDVLGNPQLWVAKVSQDDLWPTCETDEVEVIAEKFNARGGANAGFSYRTKDLEPLRVEGAMLALGLNPHWVSPPQQYFAGGDGKAKKKQAQHRWLKENGLYVTGKMVGCDNADDVRSAIAHAVAYLVRQKHRPTIEHYFPKGEA